MGCIQLMRGAAGEGETWRQFEEARKLHAHAIARHAEWYGGLGAILDEIDSDGLNRCDVDCTAAAFMWVMMEPCCPGYQHGIGTYASHRRHSCTVCTVRPLAWLSGRTIAACQPSMTCRLQEHWKEHHVHTKAGTAVRAVWLSIHTDSVSGIDMDDAGLAGPGLPTASTVQPPQPHCVSGWSVASTPSLEAPRRPSCVLCCVGPTPLHANFGAHGDPYSQRFFVDLPPTVQGTLRWSADACDRSSGPWRSYLLLLSESAALADHEIVFPNQIGHAGRTIFNATLVHTLTFLADPCTSEV
jgi:hypothetical protein